MRGRNNLRCTDAALRTFACALSLAVSAAPAGAADLHWNAPEDCARAQRVKQQVERLLGRDLAGIDSLDFEVRIERARTNAWRLLLRTLPREENAAPREREIEGASCREVSNAAAVAIAMAVAEREQHGEMESKPAGVPGEEPGTGDRGGSPDSKSEPGPAPATPGRASTERPGDEAPSLPEETGNRLLPGLGAGAVLDVGALPEPGAGLQIELSLAYGLLRLTALGALFASQEKRLQDGERGGEFGLALGGLLACAEKPFGRLRLSACGGFELGMMSAKGIVDHPLTGNAFWRAPRLEAGVGWELGAGFRLAARAGAVVPLARDEFVVDEQDRVHRAGNLTGRGLLAIEFWP